MSDDYLLGHDETEWARLSRQHALWGPSLLSRLRALGAERARSRGLQVLQGDLFEVEPAQPVDLVVARWVFSFLDRPEQAIDRLAGWLRPGGWLVIQDYDHSALGVWPRQPAVDRVIEGFRSAYRARGGDLWVAPKVPGWMRACGLEAIDTAPEVRSGPPGSAVWCWVEDFLAGHVDTVHRDGHLDDEDLRLFHRAWAGLRRDPGSLLVSPVQLTVCGRRGQRT